MPKSICGGTEEGVPNTPGMALLSRDSRTCPERIRASTHDLDVAWVSSFSLFSYQGMGPSLIPLCLYLSSSCSQTCSSLNPFLVPLSHILTKRIWENRVNYFCFFPLLSLLLVLPSFFLQISFWLCLSSVISTKEANPGKSALGKSTDR